MATALGLVLAGASLVPGRSLADDPAQTGTSPSSQESVPEGPGPGAAPAAVPGQPAPAATVAVSHWPQIVGAQYTFIRQHQTASPVSGRWRDWLSAGGWAATLRA
jgi:hypothetical protein